MKRHPMPMLTDEFRKDRPKLVVGTENINAVQKLIMQNRHVTYCEIEATLGISSSSIYETLHEHFSREEDLIFLDPT